MLSQHGHCSLNSHTHRRSITLRGLLFLFEILGCEPGEKTISLLPICLSGQMIPVSLKGGVVAINCPFCGHSSSWLGLCLSRRWSGLKSVLLCLLPTPVGAIMCQMQMEDLQSTSLLWKVTSKDAHPSKAGDAGLCCSMLQPHWLENRQKAWIFKNIWIFLIFFLLWKKDFCFGIWLDMCGFYNAEKNVWHRNL